jgi:hypothetical protein
MSGDYDFTNYGKPCEIHQISLGDRVSTDHSLQGNAGYPSHQINPTVMGSSIHVLGQR